jgi:diguanylate cyclase (GGDEF)-like protein
LDEVTSEVEASMPDESTVRREMMTRLIVERQLVTSHFQPIVDLHLGTVMAWEVLSRGPDPIALPSEILALATQIGLAARFEQICLSVALRTIAGFPSSTRARCFFLNLGSGVVPTPGSRDGDLQAELARFGVDHRNIVLEVSERESIGDYAAFERCILNYAEKGFRVALSNLGVGRAGLVTLVSCSPHAMKLDISVSRGIEREAHTQHLVKSLVAFADSTGAALIADGVETWQELETLARLGVRYAQGHLFAGPARRPCEIPEEIQRELRRFMRQFSYRQSELNETVSPLVVRCTAIREGEKRGEDVDRMFRNAPMLDHLVVLRGQQPVGLITRQHYYARTGGPVGYHLYQWKPAEELARSAPLVVEESIDVTGLAKLAMERPVDELYDPVVVTDGAGHLIGTVTIRQLIMRSTALEVQSAQGSSPLTGLPGNRSIESWILGVLDRAEGCVLYADLDRFKEFNDRYGFLKGDEMIRCLARVLSCALPGFSPEARLGHIGGDDFVVVAPALIDADRVSALCQEFDSAKLDLFSAEDIERGSFPANDRRGQEYSVPLVTLSVAVVPTAAARNDDHPGALAQIAASLKRKVKEMTAVSGKSAFLYERRRSSRA